LPDAQGTLGFIGACTENFCSRCNRLRLSADGYLYPCLGHGVRVDPKPALQQPPEQCEAAILTAVARALNRKPEGHQFLTLRNATTSVMAQHIVYSRQALTRPI
jgi:cyclic pyranopterin phosphate synthase